MEKMKAAVVREFGKPLSLEEVPVPTPREGEVLIKVHCTGVCHTDLHAAEGDWPVRPELPFIPGHEGVGTVVSKGPGVQSPEVGEIVGVPWLQRACGSCEYCVSGREALCPLQENTGYSANGSFAGYMVAPAAFACILPEEMDLFQAAPVLCAGVTTYKGLKETGARPGEWVVVSGVGGLGHMAVQYAAAMGFLVAAIDVSDEKLELARSLGAEVTVNARDGDPAGEIRSRTGGAHGVLITAVSPAAFAQGISMLRRGGTAVLVGLPPGEFPLPIFDIVLKGLTVRGSIVGTRKDLQEALELAARGKVKAAVESFALEEVNDVLARLKEGKIRGRAVLSIERGFTRREKRKERTR